MFKIITKIIILFLLFQAAVYAAAPEVISNPVTTVDEDSFYPSVSM